MRIIIFSRCKQLLFVLLMLSIVTFLLMKLAPGDPIRNILKVDDVAATVEMEEELRQQLGLDQPFLVQYGKWLLQVLRLDLGTSYISKRPVVEELLSRLPSTLILTAGGLIIMLLLAVPLGILSAFYQGSWVDHLSRVFALLGAALPSFWLGLLLIYFFSLKLHWLPSFGQGSMKHLLLPCFTLGLSLAAVYARLIRAGLLENLSQEYIRAARMRGLGEWRILLKHALRGTLLPLITVLGLSFGYLMGGAVVVELLFSRPGLGKLVIDAIMKRDYPVIQGYVLLIGVVVILINLLVDLSYRFVDPRIRLGERSEK